MNWKITALVLGWGSALGVSYFAFDALTSLGDWATAWAASPYIFIVALLATVPPTVAVWMGIIMIEQSTTTKRVLTWFLSTTVGAWAWLFVGLIYLALQRLQ
jgi:hypothetical protein